MHKHIKPEADELQLNIFNIYKQLQYVKINVNIQQSPAFPSILESLN